MRRFLLIVRAGDASLHPQWIAGAAPRNFDLMVSYYGATPDRYRDHADHYHVMTGPRWPAHVEICRDQWDLLRRYSRVGFACDDLGADPATWNQLFSLSDWYELDLAQPTVEGHASYDVTRPQAGCLLRYTNWVEVMAPVFSLRALERVRPTLAESVSGWGLGVLWSPLLPWPEYRTAIVDAARVRHATPVRGGELRGTLDRLGVDPRREMLEVLRRHGIGRFEIVEHARLSMDFAERR